MIVNSSQFVLGNMQALNKKLSLVKKAIGIIEARFARTQRFHLRTRKHQAGCILLLNKIFVVSCFIVNDHRMTASVSLFQTTKISIKTTARLWTGLLTGL